VQGVFDYVKYGGHLGIKREPEAFKGIRSKGPSEVLNRKLASPSELARLFTVLMRSADTKAQMGYLQSMQVAVRNDDGTVKLDTVAVFVVGDVPEGLRYGKFEKDAGLRQAIADMFGPGAQVTGHDSHLVLVDFDKSKFGAQYENFQLLSDREAASLYYCNLAAHEAKNSDFAAAEKSLGLARDYWPGNPAFSESASQLRLQRSANSPEFRLSTPVKASAPAPAANAAAEFAAWMQRGSAYADLAKQYLEKRSGPREEAVKIFQNALRSYDAAADMLRQAPQSPDTAGKLSQLSEARKEVQSLLSALQAEPAPEKAPKARR
ncbi:MAG: hypothetical protein WC759_05570, partial [Candidatus Micrarchaeia archaeon]|jgi:hypothetical protein